MEIKRIKTEVKFSNIEIFEPFEYQDKMYLRLPKRICRIDVHIGNGLTKEAKGDFNAVLIRDNYNNDYNDYVDLKQDTMVRKFNAKLNIYE